MIVRPLIGTSLKVSSIGKAWPGLDCLPPIEPRDQGF